MKEKPHTDINPQGRFLACAPRKWRPYILLARLDRPVGIWLLLLPGWWAIALSSISAEIKSASPLYLSALFAIGAVVMRAAGCVVNDLWDRDLDAQVERTKSRPLASGQIGIRQAFFFLGALLLLGLMVLLQMNTLTIALGFATLPLIAIYPLMKRITWWPQAFLGLTFNAGALMGWTAMTGTLDLPAILLYAAGIFWTLGYDTVYAYQDCENDALAGIRSSALRVGKSGKFWVSAFYALSWGLTAFAAWKVSGNSLSSLYLLPAAAHLVLQVKRLDLTSPQNALAVFRSNRNYGFLVLGGLIFQAMTI